MIVANSFDLWKKDTFFSAAEEVQQSADIMESTFRIWAKERREGVSTEDLDQLSKDLQTTLGTAKWQLEEFEKAVRMSHAHRYEDKTSDRHKQFIKAIEHQISRVEAALTEAFSDAGKKPLRWVNLDEQEYDDLAMFLSGVQTTRPIKNGVLDNLQTRIGGDSSFITTSTRDFSEETKDARNCDTSVDKSTDCIIDIDEADSPGVSDDIIGLPDKTSARRTRTSPNYSALRIVIPDEESSKSMMTVEATPKDKGIKSLLWKQKRRDHLQANGAVIYSNKLLYQLGCLKRQLQNPMHFQFGCSIRLVLALLLTIFLAVHFVLYLA